MQDHIFRAYDIRGIVATELLLDQVYDLGRAIAAYFKEQNQNLRTVAVGRDGRTHSPAIHQDLIAALRDSGLNVISIGVCTTPVAYFSEYWLPVDAALMITASHNPKDYNGIKLTLGKRSIAGAQLQIVKQYYQEKKFLTPTTIGSYQEYDLVADYVEYLARLFPHLMGSQYPLVLDCGNGAAGAVIPALVKRMQLTNTHVMYGEIDGNYPHHTADPTEFENMQDLLHEITVRDLPFGIGFDGDADRMGVIAASGKLVSGDVLLSGWSRIVGTQVPGAAVVYDVKCSDGLREVVEQSGMIPVASPSGHAFIKGAMRQNKALLGGELSCHFFFHDRYFGFDDGIYAALRLLELVTTYTTSVEAVVASFPYRESSPELRIACSHASKQVVEAVKQYFADRHNRKVTELDGVRVDTTAGWGLIRGSNTQPVICLRFEAHTLADLYDIKDEFISALEPYFSREFLQEQVKW